MNNPRLPLSIVILTLNESANLQDCLDSIKPLNVNVFVVDSGSSDNTVKIAKEAGATVTEHPFSNYAAQRNWAQENLDLDTEWVLHLDADERLTPELLEEIHQALIDAPKDVNGFMLRQRTVFMGRWIKYGGHYPSYHLRLFRKTFGRCETRLYDQHFIVDGNVANLKNDYIDTIGTDLSTWSQRHIRWAEMEAKEIMSDSETRDGDQIIPRFFGTPIERRRWLRRRLYARFPLFLRAFGYWGYRYFLRLGFLDGREGLIFHFLQGCWLRFLIDAKLHEERIK